MIAERGKCVDPNAGIVVVGGVELRMDARPELTEVPGDEGHDIGKARQTSNREFCAAEVNRYPKVLSLGAEVEGDTLDLVPIRLFRLADDLALSVLLLCDTTCETFQFQI